MRNFVPLLFLLAQGGQISFARNLTYFELVNNNGNLNGSINSEIYNETTTSKTKAINVKGTPTSVAPGTTKESSNVTGQIDSHNGTSPKNHTDKSWAVFSPDFWSNLLGIFSGNVKIGIHGDLSNVASGNLESRGSIGMSVNGQDLTVGAKFGIGGNLGQGVSNTGSIGAGGKVLAKPSIHFNRPKFSLGKMPFFSNANVKEVNAKGGNGNWQNIKQYFKVFVDKER